MIRICFCSCALLLKKCTTTKCCAFDTTLTRPLCPARSCQTSIVIKYQTLLILPVITECGVTLRPGAAAGQEEVVRAPMPKKPKREMFGIADQLMGASKIKVMCEDGKSRMGRIPGKLKKRMWIREGDLLIIRPWEFQDEKADVVYRYTRTQSSYLSRKGAIPEVINVF